MHSRIIAATVVEGGGVGVGYGVNTRGRLQSELKKVARVLRCIPHAVIHCGFHRNAPRVGCRHFVWEQHLGDLKVRLELGLHAGGYRDVVKESLQARGWLPAWWRRTHSRGCHPGRQQLLQHNRRRRWRP